MVQKRVAVFEIGIAFNFIFYRQEESFPSKKNVRFIECPLFKLPYRLKKRFYNI